MHRFRPHGRQSRRLSAYDYTSPGGYFVTIVTQDRQQVLSRVDAGTVHLSQAGRIVRDVWEDLPRRFPTIDTDAFVIMPDHVHGVITIWDDFAFAGAGLVPAPTAQYDRGRGVATTGVDAGTAAIRAAAARNDAGDAMATTGVVAAGAGLVPTRPARRAPNTIVIADLDPAGVVAAGAATKAAPPPDPCDTARPSVGDVVGAFKSLTTVSYIHGVRELGWPEYRRRLWQRNYHERVIRDHEHLSRVRQYIVENPLRWRST